MKIKMGCTHWYEKNKKNIAISKFDDPSKPQLLLFLPARLALNTFPQKESVNA
jgi:hypothetical protein